MQFQNSEKEVIMSQNNKRSFLIPLVGLFALLLVWMLMASNTAKVTGAQTDLPADTQTATAFANAGCTGCHTIPGVPNAVGQVGPDLSAIGSEAGDRVAGTDAESYILESILDPNAVIAPLCPSGGECPANVMPPNMGERLSSTEIDLIVSYLLTKQGGGVAVVAYELTPIEVVRPAEASVIPFAEPPKSYDDAVVLLGKYLFFDPRISADANVSCASCHNPENAWANNDALSRGYTGNEYFRNTPTLMNTVYMDYLYWDGRMDGGDMPTLVRDHITEAHFMAQDGRLMTERIKQVPEYVALFEEAWGKGPSFGGILKSITAYTQSINSGMTPYDNFMAGDTAALSADAAAGLELFDANCASCHSGAVFSDNEFHNTGVPQNGDIWANPQRHIIFRRFFRQLGVPNYRNLTEDPGRFAVTKEDEDLGAIRTAPLREVARTAPYMHNGVYSTLEEVVEFYNDSMGLNLSSEEMSQLVAFLQSLSSESVTFEPVEQPAYQLRPLGDNR